ncbi:LacI family DNA-binding transcriptional regulator [Coraliomargarita sp. SDUM461004]|uniref:LacI family DNA-binding transcriptional regulator n=1 Tax=Thalassobacterium sedimentorum TaxID=3041258 RepID=A0ABU1AM64_9BACT|nr:LacI family DNA-binding transcriptional regulator [Coraliomargarita sp. SDUM461004]MDQ8194693.1 LacI family DNA-binding transcriptional regulator [Coraliomargarita sp. SDUM461004]
MKQRVSMRDIAKAADVSVMTVSLALKNSPRCANATRRRILALADEMGFSPDPALRALVSYRHQKNNPSYSGTIAYINNTASPNLVKRGGYHQNLFDGASERGKQLGYKVEEFWINEPGVKRDRISQILQARGIQGLILGPQVSAHSKLILDWQHFCVVQIGFSLESPKFHTIGADVYKAVFRIMLELCRLGYRRIGLALNHHQDERVENRYSGAYLAVQNKMPSTYQRIPILCEDDIDASAFSSWYYMHRPDAIICGQNKCVEFLQAMGISIPKDVGYVAPFKANLDQFAHADGRQEDSGQKAVEILSGMIDRNERGIPESRMIHTVEPLWNSGKTVLRQGAAVPLEYPVE